MAVTSLVDPQSCASFFQRRILINIQYWQDYVAQQTADVLALDTERDCTLKAIVFALELEEAWPYVYKLVVAFSPYMERRGHWEIWNQLLDHAIQVAQRVNDTSGALTLSVMLARLLQRQSQFSQAIARYHRIIHLARQADNQFEEARACTNLGYLSIEQGYWRRAEVLCCHALTLFEQVNSDHGRAHTENHLGILYTRQGRWDSARQRLERACALWQSMGDDHGLMRGFINLGMLYNEMERPEESLHYLHKALAQAQLTGEEAETGTIYMNMGVAYYLQGDLAQAKAYHWQAETIFRRFANSVGLALVWIDLGAIHLEQQGWTKAREYLEAAVEAGQRLKNEYAEMKARLGLVEYELARGDQTQAMARLNELERLLQPYTEDVRYRSLQMLFDKYHYVLTGQMPQTSEESAHTAGPTSEV